MSTSRALAALSAAIGILISVSAAAAASDHENQSGGFRYGPQGQVFGAPSYGTARAAYAAQPKAERARTRASARAAYGAAVDPVSALDSLAIQHKDKGWDHRYQSWCDIDPNCNGWNKKMQEYEGTLK